MPACAAGSIPDPRRRSRSACRASVARDGPTPPESPVTAAHSSGVIDSRIEQRTRKSASFARQSATASTRGRSVRDRRAARSARRSPRSSCGARSIVEAAICRPIGQPSVSSCRRTQSSSVMRSPNLRCRISTESSSASRRSSTPTLASVAARPQVGQRQRQRSARADRSVAGSAERCTADRTPPRRGWPQAAGRRRRERSRSASRSSAISASSAVSASASRPGWIEPSSASSTLRPLRPTRRTQRREHDFGETCGRVLSGPASPRRRRRRARARHVATGPAASSCRSPAER